VLSKQGAVFAYAVGLCYRRDSVTRVLALALTSCQRFGIRGAARVKAAAAWFAAPCAVEPGARAPLLYSKCALSPRAMSAAPSTILAEHPLCVAMGRVAILGGRKP
jgi:hypothetical protein